MSQTSQRRKKVGDLVSDKIDLMEFGHYRGSNRSLACAMDGRI